MSHSSLLVAVDDVNPSDRAAVQQRVAYQMEPFRQNGEWSSRWDWYQLGGRFSGHLSGYDPNEDAANLVVCDLCGGTGERPRAQERLGKKKWNDLNGCFKCNGTGLAPKWPTERAPHEGDAICKKDVKVCPFPAFRAFLRNCQWHDGPPVVFLDRTAAIEPEQADERPEGRCLQEHAGRSAKIFSWNDNRFVRPLPDDTLEVVDRWAERFYSRFVRPLPEDTVLVAVDVHN